jgi:hypothetical protein
LEPLKSLCLSAKLVALGGEPHHVAAQLVTVAAQLFVNGVAVLLP